LENAFVGSPFARARQPILSANWNFLSFKMKFEPIFFRNALTKIETGVIKKPSVFVMAKIAKTLNITLDDLLK